VEFRPKDFDRRGRCDRREDFTQQHRAGDDRVAREMALCRRMPRWEVDRCHSAETNGGAARFRADELMNTGCVTFGHRSLQAFWQVGKHRWPGNKRSLREANASHGPPGCCWSAVNCAATSFKICEPSRGRDRGDPPQVQLRQSRQRRETRRQTRYWVAPQIDLPQLRQGANTFRQ
jgi:hypothetical protein